MPKPDISESTVARIAGNIARHMVNISGVPCEGAARRAVALARAIVAEVRRTAQVNMESQDDD